MSSPEEESENGRRSAAPRPQAAVRSRSASDLPLSRDLSPDSKPPARTDNTPPPSSLDAIELDGFGRLVIGSPSQPSNTQELQVAFEKLRIESPYKAQELLAAFEEMRIERRSQAEELHATFEELRVERTMILQRAQELAQQMDLLPQIRATMQEFTGLNARRDTQSARHVACERRFMSQSQRFADSIESARLCGVALPDALQDPIRLLAPDDGPYPFNLALFETLQRDLIENLLVEQRFDTCTVNALEQSSTTWHAVNDWKEEEVAFQQHQRLLLDAISTRLDQNQTVAERQATMELMVSFFHEAVAHSEQLIASHGARVEALERANEMMEAQQDLLLEALTQHLCAKRHCGVVPVHSPPTKAERMAAAVEAYRKGKEYIPGWTTEGAFCGQCQRVKCSTGRCVQHPPVPEDKVTQF